jgi:hypothetical protein
MVVSNPALKNRGGQTASEIVVAVEITKTRSTSSRASPTLIRKRVLNNRTGISGLCWRWNAAVPLAIASFANRRRNPSLPLRVTTAG